MVDETKKVQLVSIESEWTVVTLKDYLLDKVATAEKLSEAKWDEQKRHNASANEWRGTISDLKRDFVPRTEYEELVKRFVNEQLSVAKILSNTVGERAGIGISWGAIVGAGGLVIAIVAGLTFISGLRSGSAVVTPPQVIYVPAPATPPTQSREQK